MSKFSTHWNEGFHMTFENGVTVSVQFGPKHYCDAREGGHDYNLPSKLDSWHCANAEVAAWDAKGKWITREIYKINANEELNDEVVGYRTTDEVLKFMNWAAAWSER